METLDVSRAPLLEIACFSEKSAVIAAEGGADRIELCQDYDTGGLSADTATLKTLKSQLSIPIYVMVRPHSNGFYYDDLEFEEMKATLKTLKSLGADGFVFGILQHPEKREHGGHAAWIDTQRNKELVQLAGGRPCTFHRAFDSIPKSCWSEALSDLRTCGFAAILTSGGSMGNGADDHKGDLASLCRQNTPFKGHKRLEIIIGGGVRSTNLQRLWYETNARSFHSSAISRAGEVCKDEVKRMKQMIQGWASGEIK